MREDIKAMKEGKDFVPYNKKDLEHPEEETPLNRQVGGSHYKNFPIQPFEFFYANSLPFHKGDIIKRICRYDLKGGKGIEDLEKIKHVCDMVITLMQKEN